LNRRKFLGTAAALGLARLGFGQEPRRRPNVVFILADDLGWGDLSCYGQVRMKTPNLDRLARQGTLFTQFYVASAVCSPSRAAFMTGHFPARHGIHSAIGGARKNKQRGIANWLDPKVPTIARLLKGAGYATGHFGKWHLVSVNAPDAPEPEAYGVEACRITGSKTHAFEGIQDPYFRARSTSLIVDEAIRFIEANRQRPFYLNVWTLIPHATLHPTEEQMEPFRGLAPGRRLPYKGAFQIYYATIRDLDTQVGRLLAKLDELGLADDTLVVFSSDNGPEDIQCRNASHSGVGSPGPLRGRKRSLYEGGVRMPFIARWPSHVPAGRADKTSVVAAVDFLPTVCKLAGVDLPKGYQPDGEDVSDILAGKPRPRTKPLFWEWRYRILGPTINQSPMLAVRDGDWKLLLNPDRSRVELYRIARDPSEVDNLADQHPDIVERLAAKALAWQKSLPQGIVDPGAGRNDYRWPGTTPPQPVKPKAPK